MKDGNKNYAETMDDFQIDFNAIKSGTNMRDSNMSNKTQLRRGKHSNRYTSKGGGVKTPSQALRSTKLPPNTGNLVQMHIISNLKDGMRHHAYWAWTAWESRLILYPHSSGNTLLIPRPNVH